MTAADMRVARYHRNSDVRVERVARPEIDAGEVLVRVLACGICGSDVAEWFRVPKAPRILGHEISGVVAQSRAAGWAEGDRVVLRNQVPCGACFACRHGHHAVCEQIIRKNAHQNAFIGVLPIPGADMPAITANQGRMVLGIAAVYGEEITFERARELTGVLAAGFGFRALTRQVVKLVPVGGWAASGAIGYAGTLAMGRTAMLYFERGKREPNPEELSKIRRWAREETKAFLSRVRRK